MPTRNREDQAQIDKSAPPWAKLAQSASASDTMIKAPLPAGVKDTPELRKRIQADLDRSRSPVTKALREALEWIDYHKDDPDMSHVNFRVEAGSRAYDALVAQPIEGKE